MTTALVLTDTTLDTLFAARLRCEVCDRQPWTTTGASHRALLCTDCLDSEPDKSPA